MPTDIFNLHEKKSTPEGLEFYARMLATMAAFGTNAVPARFAPADGAGAAALSEPDTVVDATQRDAGLDEIVYIWAPPLNSPFSATSAANKARGAKLMAT